MTRADRPLRAARFAGIEETDGIIEDHLPPGVCIWRYPRRVYEARNGTRKRIRLYSVTHAATGVGLVSGRLGTLAAARKAAWALADVRYRRKPVDLTWPVDTLYKIDRFRFSALALSGYFLIGADYDAETHAWADRNGVDLEAWKPSRKAVA